MTARTLRSVCAWCSKLIRDGASPTSHGICPACREEIERDAGLTQDAGQDSADVLDGGGPLADGNGSSGLMAPTLAPRGA